jgi:NTE family protein
MIPVTGGRVAVVFSGGASYGAYEVGIMKALAGGYSGASSFLPLDAAVFAGTSAGAYNAALLTGKSGCGLPAAVASLEKIWLDEISSSPGGCGNGVIRYRVNPFELVDPACANDPNPLKRFFMDARGVVEDSVRRGVDFFRSTASLGQRAFDLVDLGVFISGWPFRALAERTVQLAAIRTAKMVLRISATNWLNGEVSVFGNRHMTDSQGHAIIVASSAIPGVFSPVDVNGVPHVDGGVLMNTPIRPAIEAGADVIHVISVNPELSAMTLPHLPSTVNTLYRMLAMSLASSINRDIEIAARLNDGIAILRAAERGVYKQGLPMQALILTLGGLAARPLQHLPYRPLTIHRHQLGEDFENFFQWLDFDRERIAWLIEKGTRDAMAHDCKASGCILP